MFKTVRNLTWAVLNNIINDLESIASNLSVTFIPKPDSKKDVKLWLDSVELYIDKIQSTIHTVDGVTVSNPFYGKSNAWEYGKQKGANKKIERWFNFIEWENQYINGKITKSRLFSLDEYGEMLAVKDINGEQISVYGG